MTQEILKQESIVKESTKDLPILLDKITSTKIVDQEGYGQAFEFTKQIKSRGKELDDLRKSLTKPLNETKKRIMDLFRKPQENLVEAERYLKGIMITYDDAQERIRQEQENKLREQAEREAEKEREKLRKKAEKAAEKGKGDLAEELKDQAESVTATNITLADTAPTPQGGSFRMKYTADVVDFSKLPDTYKIADTKALNAFIQAKKGEVSIPGVKVKSEKIMSVR